MSSMYTVCQKMRYPILLLLVQLAAISLCSNAVYADGIIELPGAVAVNVQEVAEHRPAAERTSLTVMTFNIRWEGYGDDGKFYDSGFARRKPLVLDVLRNFGADIIGLQEATVEQRAAIIPELPEFGMFPLPNESGYESILYRLNRFDLKDNGRENLRRTPEIPGTNIGVRDFVWVYLHDRISDKRFYVLNLHTDHRSSRRGRQLDGVLIGEWIRNREFSDPVILVGDFNGTPDKPRYLYLTGQKAYPGEDGKTYRMPMPMLDTFTEANPNARYSGTSNPGFKGEKNSYQIDYIFVPKGSTVIDSRIVYYHLNGTYPSDHYPLISEFELR